MSAKEYGALDFGGPKAAADIDLERRKIVFKGVLKKFLCLRVKRSQLRPDCPSREYLQAAYPFAVAPAIVRRMAKSAKTAKAGLSPVSGRQVPGSAMMMTNPPRTLPHGTSSAFVPARRTRNKLSVPSSSRVGTHWTVVPRAMCRGHFSIARRYRQQFGDNSTWVYVGGSAARIEAWRLIRIGRAYLEADQAPCDRSGRRCRIRW